RLLPLPPTSPNRLAGCGPSCRHRAQENDSVPSARRPVSFSLRLERSEWGRTRVVSARAMAPSVLVLVMNVRIVRMRVAHRPMDMAMRVWLDPIPIRIMTMTMVRVMYMGMRMLEQLVLMRVFVHFGQMQPD